MSAQTRKPKGSSGSTGGQFAPQRAGEPDVQIESWSIAAENGSDPGSWQIIDIVADPDPSDLDDPYFTDYGPGLYRLTVDGVPGPEIPVGRVYTTRDDAIADMGTGFGEHARDYDLDGIFDDTHVWTEAHGGGYVQAVSDEHFWVIAERHPARN